VNPGGCIFPSAPILHGPGVDAGSVQWSAHIGNIKVFRRTNDPNDLMEAAIPPFMTISGTPLPAYVTTSLKANLCHWAICNM
jgi:hypothetical protein